MPRGLVVALLAMGASVHADPATPRAARIELQELTVNFDGYPIAKLHRDGTSEYVGNNAPGPDAKFEPGPTFHASGIIDLRAGYQARVDAKGDIYVVSPRATKTPDKLFAHVDGTKIRFAAGGGLELDGATVKLISNGRWEELGEVRPPQLGRTALLMATALYIAAGIPDAARKP